MALFKKNKKEKESEFKKGDVAMNPNEIPEGEVVSETTINEPVAIVPEIEQSQIKEPTIEKSLTKESIKKQQEELNQRVEELNKREEELRPKERIQIVKELPMQPVRTYTQENGSIIHLMTIEEYLTEQANLE